MITFVSCWRMLSAKSLFVVQIGKQLLQHIWHHAIANGLARKQKLREASGVDCLYNIWHQLFFQVVLLQCVTSCARLTGGLSWSSLRKHHNFIDDHDNLDDYDDHDDINFFPKLKNDWSPLSSTFHEEQPETLVEWKFKNITDGRTDPVCKPRTRRHQITSTTTATPCASSLKWVYFEGVW